jgi:hypothetical protein
MSQRGGVPRRESRRTTAAGVCPFLIGQEREGQYRGVMWGTSRSSIATRLTNRGKDVALSIKSGTLRLTYWGRAPLLPVLYPGWRPPTQTAM